MFLYDATSHYFEGQHNALAEYGYPRDIKKGKKQVVAGLLTDGQGEPLSIQLYPGNTGDAPTFLDPSCADFDNSSLTNSMSMQPLTQ